MYGAITVIFILIGLFIIIKSIKYYKKKEREEYNKNYPELELLGKLYKNPNFNKKRESLLIAQHHLRCVNYEVLKGNFNMVKYHNDRYKEEHKKIYGY